MRIVDLRPGDRVTLLGRSATFVAQTIHPLWPHLRLVIWRMDDGSWSHDALSELLEAGEAEPTDHIQRRSNLRRALLGDD